MRAVGNWVNLSTPFGLVVARIGRATVLPGPRHTYLAVGYRLPFPVASAFTVGNVIISGRRREQLGDRLLAHEERHSWQWFALLGVLFLPAYLVAMGWSWLRTGDRASANVFERHAGLALGSYPERPVRPWRTSVSEFRTLLRRPSR